MTPQQNRPHYSSLSCKEANMFSIGNVTHGVPFSTGGCPSAEVTCVDVSNQRRLGVA